MFGKELKNAREAAGLSQEKLAFEAEIDRSYVSLLENDKKSPTLETLFRIADAIGIRASELISRVERSRRPKAAAKGSKQRR